MSSLAFSAKLTNHVYCRAVRRGTNNTETKVVVLVVSIVVVAVVVIAATAVIAVVAVVRVDISTPQVLLKTYPLKYIRLRLSGILAFI